MNKESGSSFGAWLFLGPEIGEKQAAIDEIRKELALNTGSQSENGLEETIYYAGDTDVATIVSNMLNGSLFADSRLFLIKCAEGIKDKKDIAMLSAVFNSPPDKTYLILISEESGISRELEKLIIPARKKIFWELFDNKKIDWVRDFFRKEGFKIGADGIDTILELVENNTAAMKQECSRLTLFLDKTREITGEDVEKYLSHTRAESAFTLFSRIASGDFSRSLESSRMLLAAKESPVAIFAALSSCFRKLISYIALKQAGVSDDNEYKKIGVSSPGAKRDYGAASRRYTSAAAETCLALTAEYDLLLRSGSSFGEQMLMDQYLYKIHSCSASK